MKVIICLRTFCALDKGLGGKPSSKVRRLLSLLHERFYKCNMEYIELDLESLAC